MTDTFPLKPHFTAEGHPNIIDARYVEKLHAIAIEGHMGAVPVVALHLPIEYAERLYRQIGDALAASRMPRPKPKHVGGNAENCRACDSSNPPYPHICPGEGDAA